MDDKMCVQKTAGKIKVLFVHSSSELYGSDKSLLNIIRGMNKEKFEIYVILPSDGPLCAEIRKISYVHLYIYDIAVLRRKNLHFSGIVKYVINFAKSIRFLKKFIKDNLIDIVDTNTAVVFPGAIAAKQLNKKSVWHIREIIKNDFENKIISALMNHYSDIIIANSKSTADSLYVNKNKIRVVYNAVANVEETGQKDKKEIIVGMAGRINRWKGQKLFIDAASQVLQHYPDVLFWIAGSAYTGEEYLKEDLEQYILAKKIEKSVKLLGQITNMEDFYREIDIFVLPSIKPEPFGLVILEAMEHKIPVIATNHGGPTEIITNGETGFLVDYQLPQMMAQNIELLISDPNLRKKMGEKSFLYKRNNFSINRMVAQIEQIFEDVYRR